MQMTARPAGPQQPTHQPGAAPKIVWVTPLLVVAQLAVWLVVRRYLLPTDEWADFAVTPATPDELSFLVAPFVHLEATHLGVNLAVLWVFGCILERKLGPVPYLTFYLGSAWFSAVMQWAVITCFHAASGDAEFRAAVGSSGAVAGLLAVYLVRFPGGRLGFPWTGFSVRASPLIVAWAGYAAIRALVGTRTGSEDGIGHWAHLSGFLFGMGVAHASRLHVAARADYLGRRAEEAWQSGDDGTASLAWSMLLAMHPDDPDVRRALVAARLALGDRPQASRLASEGLGLLVRSGRAETAVHAYREYIALLGSLTLPAGVRFKLADWLRNAGAHREAYLAYVAAAAEEVHPDSACACLERAARTASEQLHDRDLAVRAWRRLVRDYPDVTLAGTAERELRGLIADRG